MENPKELVEARIHLHAIARSEITRHRKRIASLTIEQQSTVESILISTVDLVSHHVFDVIENYPEGVRKKCVNSWCTGAESTEGVS
jgi:hypothetical protein